jgi:hypothetical protein
MTIGTPQLYSLYDEDIRSLINTHVGAANYLLRPVQSARTHPDIKFSTNEDVWRATLPPREDLHANVIVRLNDCFLFEWFPRSPGLFHTREGRQAREAAENFRQRLPTSRLLPAHKLRQDGDKTTNGEFLEIFDPYGKMSMLKGGIGCIRLRSKLVDSEEVWFMSASSSGVAHEGFPVAIPDYVYQRYIDDVRRLGAIRCELTGKLRFLPEPLVELYRGYRGVPQLYLLVEELRPIQRGRTSELFVTVGVSFLSSFEGQRKMYASYATFDPRVAEAVSETALWLEEVYVEGLYGGAVATDFDEQMARFANATFSLKGLMRNELNTTAVQTFVDTVNIYGGDTAGLFSGLKQIERVYIERIEKMDQTGGVNISGTNVTVGGDVVGRDKIVGTEISNAQLDQLFGPLAEAVRNAPRTVQQDATQKVEELKKEAAKGKSASDSAMAKLVDGLVGLVPGAVGAVVSAFATPILGGIAGPATKYVLDKIQSK